MFTNPCNEQADQGTDANQPSKGDEVLDIAYTETKLRGNKYKIEG